MTDIFHRVLEASWQASVLVLVVLTLQRLARRRLSPGWHCAMWTLVLARLLMPSLPESRFSVFGLVHRSERSQVVAPETKVAYGVIPDDTVFQPAALVSQSLAPSRQINWAAMVPVVWILGGLVVLVRLLIIN